MEILTKSAKETKDFGEKFANKLTGGEILALTGDLGSGKTTFVQGLAKGLGVKGRVISPTFILMREYNLRFTNDPPASHTRKRFGRGDLWITNLYHIDLYRLEKKVESELINLGIKDLWGKKKNIVVVEWAEKAKGIFPANTIWIKFEYLGRDKRKIVSDKL